MALDQGLRIAAPAHCIVVGGAQPGVQSLLRPHGSRHLHHTFAPLGRGNGECWPDPRAELVFLYNGSNHFCGLCPCGWPKPAIEGTMGAGSCPELHEWLAFYTVDIWPSTPLGFCGAESIAMSRMLLAGG